MEALIEYVIITMLHSRSSKLVVSIQSCSEMLTQCKRVDAEATSQQIGPIRITRKT